MPTHTVWIDPELLLEHESVRVFLTYKEDDYDQGTRVYWFTVNPQCGELDRLCDDQPCRHVFDVRELSTWQPPAQPPFCTGANDTPENHAAWERYREHEYAAMLTTIRTAIERGELTSRGRIAVSEAKNRETTASSVSAGADPLPAEPSITGKDLDHS
ncbi:MAG: hypothetical protein WCL11_28385 [Verrucomicrobiota bacterium]